MSRWHETFEQHPIHQILSAVQVLLKEKELRKLDAEQEQEIARIRKCASLVAKTLSTLDQELINFGPLNQINQQLVAIQQNLNNFKNNQSLPELQAANNAVDTILNNLPALMPGTAAQSADVSVNSMLERGERFLKTLDQRKKELQNQIAGLKKSATDLNSRLEELKSRIDERLAALDQLSNEWVQQFNTSQNERGERFDKSMSRIEQTATSKTEALVEELRGVVTEFRESYETEIDALIEDAHDRHEKIRTLHGLIAQDSITGGHKHSADKEASSANFWRWASLFFVVTAAGWLVFVFMRAEVINWQSSLGGFPLTLVLLSAAGYAAHQSSQHRRQSNRQRQFALEMIAIDPYLENLGEEERKKVKENLAAKYFGHVYDERGHKSDKDYTMLPSSLPEWFASLITRGGG